MSIDLKRIKTYTDGKAMFLVALFEQIGLGNILDAAMTSDTGRRPDIPYSVLGQMMLVNLCDDHHPLSRMDDYFKFKDVESIFNYPIELSQLNDDRFGGFLDLFHDAGPRKIFGQIAANAFVHYGLEVSSVNFDTTSKVMWGTYKVEGKEEGVIEIDYGYSKQNRMDKKQIKVALGAANGILVDSKVLSGHMDDKTYNKEQLDDVEDLLKLLNIDLETFYYIADSALFCLENLIKAQAKGIKLITRIPDNTTVVKELIETATTNFSQMTEIETQTDKGAKYRIMEAHGDYHSIPLQYAVCYSEELNKKKAVSIGKQVLADTEQLEKLIKGYEKRTFACLKDVEIELDKVLSKLLKKFKYHNVNTHITEHLKRKAGRPSKDTSENMTTTVYKIGLTFEKNQQFVYTQTLSQSMFVLCTNDLKMDALSLFKEYKTQGQVEKKFQQLKSPQLVNALYLNSPKRIEALMYLLLISVMVLSIAEFVVRRELKKEAITIVGPGKVVMKKPSLVAIYGIFHEVQTIVYHAGAQTQREFTHPLNASILKVLKCLGVPPDIFIRSPEHLCEF